MQRQRFSLRKYKSVWLLFCLGTALVFGAGQARADEQATASSSGQGQPIAAVVSATESASQAATSKSQPATPATVEKAAPASSESAASSTEQVSQPSTAEAKEASAAPVEKGATSSSEQASSSAEKVTQPSTTESKPTAPASPRPTVESPSAVNSDKPAANPGATAEPAASQDAKPSSISTNEIIKVPQTWSQGYKGQGRLVAIIDSGLDVHHEVLKISDPSKAKYQTEAALEEAKKKAGIDYGKWYNSKVVYAYNYIDGDDNIKEKNSYSHGMHVTGISAGNPNQESS